MTLTANNILVRGGGTATFDSGVVLQGGATEIGLLVNSGSTLVVNGVLTGTGNATVGLSGTTLFTTPQYFNTGTNYFSVNGGTVSLASGGNNTFYPGLQAGTAGQYLALGNTGLLDLNGTLQTVGDLRSGNNVALPGIGGTITSLSGAAATLVSSSANADDWSGQIIGNVYYNKAGAGATNFHSNNTFSGGALTAAA